MKRFSDSSPSADRAASAPLLPPALAAARLVLAGGGNVMLVTENEQRAHAIARIAAAFDREAEVIHLPASDALPGDAAPASPANVGQRVAALRRLRLATTAADPRPVLLLLSAEAIAVRYPAPEAFDAALPIFKMGDAVDPEAFAEQAEGLGYIIDDRVDEPGEVAIRGGVIDLFPTDHDTPVRLEHAEGKVSALRAYDPVSQRSTDDLEQVTIGHATEPAMGAGVPITDHLPGATVHHDAGALARRDRFLALAVDGLPRRRAGAGLVDAKSWTKAAGDRLGEALGEAGLPPPPRFVEERDPARSFRRFAKGVTADRPLVVAGTPRDLRFLARQVKLPAQAAPSLAAAVAADPGIVTLAAPVERGFALERAVVVAAADLLGSRAQLAEGRAGAAQAFISSELHVGDVVVHEDHGIGVVSGLETLSGEEGAAPGDGIVLEYAKDTHRVVPVGEAGRIWRYGADSDAVTLDTLDGASWQKRRGAIDAAIAESATTLHELARANEALETPPIVAPGADYERFAAGFPFALTADQARAIEAVRSDLASGRPMHRLVVGDVGYGKTEVALRAAAMVALAGRQVAVVAPTTVLARQHLDTFRARFEGTGLNVASLSRLANTAERKRVAAGLADGSIAVVVGTSAVAGKGVGFADLALVVIDEEQRFGTAAKAKLRDLGTGHVLTLSATPIPRTLQSALVGLQAISVIATPPARRQPIRTTVGTFDDTVVRKALLRERARGGQSFVVVPRIADIEPLAEKLGKLVPELELVVAHGKVPVEELDETMVGFAAGRGDVLLATNIIEAGLDVPRANTMIVHKADRFGLSQLHQLRGRVGRGGRRGQMLILTDAGADVAEATVKRLRTLQALDQLGAGFAISARDLDMRGAGDLVGEEQAGHMKLIGVDLYQHLLGHALRKARGEAADRWVPVLNLGMGGRLPEDWIPEVDVRLSLYGQLAHLEEVADIDAFQAELEDRFGELPVEAAQLVERARIGALAAAAGVRQIDAGPAAIALTMVDGQARLGPPLEFANGRWLLRERIEDGAARIDRVRELLGELIDTA